MNNKLLYSIMIILIIISAFLLISKQNLFLQEESIDSGSILNLSYRAEMEFPPDTAKILLGVITRSKNLDEARAENNKKISDIKKSLAEYENLEIKTESYNLQTVYENKENTKEKIQFYQLRNIMEVSTSDISLISKIIDKSLNSGVNNIYSLEYLLSDEKEAREQVIKKAINGIENKAQLVSNELNKKSLELKNINVDDNISGRNIYYNSLKSNLAESADNSTEINPDKIKINVNIRGEYLLLD